MTFVELRRIERAERGNHTSHFKTCQGKLLMKWASFQRVVLGALHCHGQGAGDSQWVKVNPR